jgi:streptomycin 3"-adenylyltransferase
VSLLDQNLIGIYLHGSLALGGFNPKRSDVDLLVVINSPLSPDEKRQIAETVLVLSCSPRAMELSVLNTANLHPWCYPPPFDFHYSEMWRDRTQAEINSGAYQHWSADHPGDPDLAAHITVVHHCGICLVGQPIATVFPPVPSEDYFASIWSDVQDEPDIIHTHPLYGVLNLCRVCWYALDGQISSKESAGEWAAHYLPEVYQPLVRQALRAYRDEISSPRFDAHALRQFAEYMVEKIKSAKTPRTQHD